MNKSLILLALIAAIFTACSKKEDENLQTNSKLQGAWTLSSQTQQGQTIIPVSKVKGMDQFGAASSKPTMQLDIQNMSLRFIESDYVQIMVTDYAFVAYNGQLIMTNTTDSSAPQETISYALSDNDTTLTLNTINDGILVFKKTQQQTLATKTALSINKEQSVDTQFFVSFAGSTASPVQISTKGHLQNIQKSNDTVVIRCSYSHQTKQATIFYSNIDDSPDTKLTLVLGIDFNLATKSENSLFTGQGSVESDIYGKKVIGNKVPCTGSMSRVEFHTKLDVRCNGLILEGADGSTVDMAAKTQCLF